MDHWAAGWAALQRWSQPYACCERLQRIMVCSRSPATPAHRRSLASQPRSTRSWRRRARCVLDENHLLGDKRRGAAVHKPTASQRQLRHCQLRAVTLEVLPLSLPRGGCTAAGCLACGVLLRCL